MIANNILIIQYTDSPFSHLKLIQYIILDVIFKIYFRHRLQTTYNLKNAPTTLAVHSWRENISGGTRTNKVEYHWSTVHTHATFLSSKLPFSYRKPDRESPKTVWQILYSFNTWSTNKMPVKLMYSTALEFLMRCESSVTISKYVSSIQNTGKCTDIWLHSFLTSVSGQFHALAASHLGKKHLICTEQRNGWAPRPVYTLWIREKYISPAGKQTKIPRLYSLYTSDYIDWVMSAPGKHTYPTLTLNVVNIPSLNFNFYIWYWVGKLPHNVDVFFIANLTENTQRFHYSCSIQPRP